MSKGKEHWFHFDSSIASQFNISFPTQCTFKLSVAYLTFTLANPDQQYADPTAFLWIGMNMATNSVVVPSGMKMKGPVFPIAYPQDKCIVIPSLVCNYAGPDVFTFTILDVNYQVVPISRLVCTFRIFFEDAQK
jgi:hypothetical protein